ncbi:MAG: hypothetical protein AAB373_03805 [Patescibacteria group bacterium]
MAEGLRKLDEIKNFSTVNEALDHMFTLLPQPVSEDIAKFRSVKRLRSSGQKPVDLDILERLKWFLINELVPHIGYRRDNSVADVDRDHLLGVIDDLKFFSRSLRVTRVIRPYEKPIIDDGLLAAVRSSLSEDMRSVMGSEADDGGVTSFYLEDYPPAKTKD